MFLHEEKSYRELAKEKGPIRVLARKYNIPTHGTIRTCVINYTKGEDLKLILPNPRYIQ